MIIILTIAISHHQHHHHHPHDHQDRAQLHGAGRQAAPCGTQGGILTSAFLRGPLGLFLFRLMYFHLSNRLVKSFKWNITSQQNNLQGYNQTMISVPLQSLPFKYSNYQYSQYGQVIRSDVFWYLTFELPAEKFNYRNAHCLFTSNTQDVFLDKHVFKQSVTVGKWCLQLL